MNDEPEYTHEKKKRSDGAIEELMKDREGRIASRRILNSHGQVVERIDYDTEGDMSGRTVYEQDGHRKPLKITAYDGKGNAIFIQERGKPPIFHGDYRASAPPFMRSKD